MRGKLLWGAAGATATAVIVTATVAAAGGRDPAEAVSVPKAVAQQELHVDASGWRVTRSPDRSGREDCLYFYADAGADGDMACGFGVPARNLLGYYGSTSEAGTRFFGVTGGGIVRVVARTADKEEEEATVGHIPDTDRGYFVVVLPAGQEVMELRGLAADGSLIERQEMLK